MPQSSLTARLLSLRPRFSLRTFLILILLSGCGLGVLSRWYQGVYVRSVAQRAIVARLTPSIPTWQSPSIAIRYAPEQNVDAVTTFARKWVHPEYQRKLKVAIVAGDLIEQNPPLDLSQLFGLEDLVIRSNSKPISEKTLATALQISGLKHLQAHVQGNADSRAKIDWSKAAAAQELEALSLQAERLSDDLAAELGKLPRLKEVEISGLSPTGLSLIAKAPELRTLFVRYELPKEYAAAALDSPEIASQRKAMERFFDQLASSSHLTNLSLTGPFLVSPEALATFAKRSKLVRLKLRVTHFDPKCLAQIAKMPDLEILTIRAPDLQLDDFTHLAHVKKLEWLFIDQKVSYEEIRRLNEKLPNLIIQRYPGN